MSVSRTSQSCYLHFHLCSQSVVFNVVGRSRKQYFEFMFSSFFRFSSRDWLENSTVWFSLSLFLLTLLRAFYVSRLHVSMNTRVYFVYQPLTYCPLYFLYSRRMNQSCILFPTASRLNLFGFLSYFVVCACVKKRLTLQRTGFPLMLA